MNVYKSIIYYTDCRIRDPIKSKVREQILKSGLPVYTTSPKPIGFGMNTVVEGQWGAFAMLQQIFVALSQADSKYVFFCEHDVLYPPSHFDFTPPRDDIYYYNDHVWRWNYPLDRLITYDRLISLSSLCANRRLLLYQYIQRMQLVIGNGWYKDTKRDPIWARRMGFEPGTKKKSRGGYFDDDFDTWKSEEPIIDIRHGLTYSRQKVELREFKHAPTNWRETTMDKIPYWNLKEMFHL